MEGGELFQRIQDRQDEGPFTERGKYIDLTKTNIGLLVFESFRLAQFVCCFKITPYAAH